MATPRPSQRDVAETSDDEGYQLMVAGASQQVDNKKASAMYLQKHCDEIHEALDVVVNPTIYSERRGQMEVFRTPEVEDMLLWYKNEHKDMYFDVLQCSWEDVFDQMARARGEHDAAVSRKGNMFKYLWRKAGSKKEAVEPWLQLFPDEYGLAIVRGAIGIFFHMAEKTHQREKSILDGFETITDIIHSAMSKGISFYSEPEMHARCQELQDSIIKGVADLICILKGEAKGKNMIERLKNKREKKKSINIEALMKKVQKKSTELDQCAARILAEKAFETNKNTSTLKKEAIISRGVLAGVADKQELHLQITEATSADVKTLGRGVQYLEVAANKLDQTVKQSLLHIEDTANATLDRYRLRIAKEVQNAVVERCSDMFNEFRNEMLLNNRRLHQQLLRAITPIPHEEAVRIGVVDLFAWIDVPFSFVNNDIDLVTTQSSRFDRRLQEQAQSSLRTNGFRHWVTSSHSQLLLVDGNMSSATRSAISPMSMLCTILPSGLGTIFDWENIVVLHYFCGLHTSASDSIGGPVGMMRTLVHDLAAAIVNQRSGRADFAIGHLPNGMSEGHYIRNLRSYHLGALMLTFERLLRLLPRDMNVFCIIDGVSGFETDAYACDLAYVVRKLDGIIDRNESMLKVFLTCPYRSTHLVPEGIINYRDHVVAEVGGRGGLGLMSERSVSNWVSR